MLSNNIFLILYALPLCYCDWISDWMVPVQDEFGVVKDLNTRRSDDANLKMFEDEEIRMGSMFDLSEPSPKASIEAASEATNLATTLLDKLQSTLSNARALAAVLSGQITLVQNRELELKEDIVNGRSGVTTVTVHTLDAAPRSYIIREGSWTLCNGVLQPPAESSYSRQGPKCIGLEVPTKQDPCMFNSIIKYETIPIRRRAEYVEDDFLCLKSGFNHTMQHYLSVPRRIVNETCKDGTVKALSDHVNECGIRVLSEYTYYPGVGAGAASSEYCAGACRLAAAWHVSDTSVESFEFLKDEPGFTQYFIKDGYAKAA